MRDLPVLQGKTVFLRPLTAEDAPQIFAQFGHKEVDRLTGSTETFTFEKVAGFYGRVQDDPDRVDYAIIPHDTPDQIVGEAVLNEIDWDHRSASFRIAIFDPQHFGKGYGSQATKLIIQHGFEALNLHRIELEVYDFNPRAQHVYEKVGFTKEGVRRDVLLWEGNYQSAIVMSILEDEYRSHYA